MVPDTRPRLNSCLLLRLAANDITGDLENPGKSPELREMAGGNVKTDRGQRESLRGQEPPKWPAALCRRCFATRRRLCPESPAYPTSAPGLPGGSLELLFRC